ncbi:MAG: DNA polymerase III subunit alpha [Alphaproteobacteria bacterium]|nr:DNA polymerase III subunit alpha [Alphaproteobacteria bacterium]
MREFSHLHGHSFHSNGLQPDALSSPREIVERAKELGLQSICLTDHASVSGLPDFMEACKELEIKPVPGCELYVTDDVITKPAKGERKYQHMLALATSWEGVQELFALLSSANRPGNFYYRPRNTYDEIVRTQNLVFTTACGGGVLGRDDYMDVCAKLHAALNADPAVPRFYVEIQPHNDPWQITVNERAIEVSKALGIPLVATQDFHYAREGQNISHEVLLAVGSGKTWSDPDRWRYPVSDLYIKNMAEMVEAFAPHVKAGRLTGTDVANGIYNARQITERVNVEWRKFDISLPKMSDEPEKELMRLCIDALNARGLIGNSEYVDRVRYEFEAIKQSGFLMYFLVLRDVIAWSRKNGIMVGPGRGSSGGSLICYLIGITTIDPIKHGLLFERFYRPGRVDLPDIDTDFEDERRDEVLSYIRRKFGDEYVAGVANYVTFGAKSAIKDVAKVFEINSFDVNSATRQVDNTASVDEVFSHDAIRPLLDKHPIIEEHARALEGRMRGLGQHAAGVVIAGVPISTRAAVWQKEDRKIACWDKRVIENMGLMKLDVLGLRTLSILRNTSENVFRNRGKRIEYDAIPLDDEKTLKIFQAGMTTGVFQFESPGMRALLKSLKVDRFSVISDANALYRPGPMDLIPHYQLAQTGEKRVVYDHPILEPILSDTYGVLIYQEQMMRIFVDMGGFSYAEADTMRKIVGKKLGPDEFRKHMGDFVKGAVEKGVDAATAEAVFNKMVAFAGYAFNKSHAVAYSIIAFWTAYVKAHYPAEFFAAHLSNSDEAQVILAMDDARKLGISIEMPDVNLSDSSKFVTLTETKILAPINAVKGIGPKAADMIVLAREGRVDHQGLGMFDTREQAAGVVAHDATHVRNGKFADEADFLRRVYKRIVNSKVQKLLQEAGALPWNKPDPETLRKNRIEILGHIYREIPTVDFGKTADVGMAVQDHLVKVLREVNEISEGMKLGGGIMPDWGSKPRLMIVMDKPSYKDADRRTFGSDDQYDVIRRLLRKTIGLSKSDFYITGLNKIYKPPLGYDSVSKTCQGWLSQEIDLINPPVILALGKGPVEFFAGPGIRMSEIHGKVIARGSTPVVLSKSPFLIYNENSAALASPETNEEFLAISEALKSIWML